ncbi:MAG: trypsin, partial [Ignavibacteria bacterium]
MSKRAVLTAISLVSVGIIFGAVLVSSFSGSSLSFADSHASFNTDAPFTPSADAASLNQTFRDVADIVTPQVVYIEVRTKAPSVANPHNFPWPFRQQNPEEPELQMGSGSGIILTEDGYILTNRHVIDKAIPDGITVTLYDNREFEARVIGEDENTDIAVIKIDASGLDAAALGNSEDVHVGEWVLAVGNPLGFTSTVTAGIVSAFSRNLGIMRGQMGRGIENFIQTDAMINQGNSGGALVNLRGQVIGINTAIAGSGQGNYMGFAVPINLAKVVSKVLIKDGKFIRGYIGVNITDIDAKTAEALGMDVYKGVLVTNLVEDGAAKSAGILEGDAITAVDGKAVESANQLQARVGMKHPGDNVKLKIWREGAYITKSVVLKPHDEEEAEETPKSITDKDPAPVSTPRSFGSSGFTVEPLSAMQREQFDR